MSDCRQTGVVNDHAWTRFFCLSALSLLATVLLSSEAFAHSPSHGPIESGYHIHNTPLGPLVTCRTVDECHEKHRQMALAPGGRCEGFDAHKTDAVGPYKFYASHWAINTSVQCDYGEGPVGVNATVFWQWLISDLPTECDNGDDAPYCPHSGDPLKPPSMRPVPTMKAIRAIHQTATNHKSK